MGQDSAVILFLSPHWEERIPTLGTRHYVTALGWILPQAGILVLPGFIHDVLGLYSFAAVFRGKEAHFRALWVIPELC